MNKSEIVANELLKRIRSGVYADRIPNRQVLAAEFSVNFKTADRAVARLVEQGIVHRKRGEGAFVTPRKHRSPVTIGLAYNKYATRVSDPVFQSLFFGINHGIKAEGCRLDITAMEMVNAPAEATPVEQGALNAAHFLDEVKNGEPDGVILLGTLHREVIELLQAHCPVVAVGHPPVDVAVDSVRRDVRGGVADAVRRLVNQGHARIAYLTYDHDEEEQATYEKRKGYQDAVQSLGLSYQHIVSRGSFQTQDLLAEVMALTPRPTAVIAAESTLGTPLLRDAPHQEVCIPRDLAVVSFDDGDVGLNFRPTMSSLRAFGEEVGRLAVETMLARLDGKAAEPVSHVLPCEFVERESSRMIDAA